MNAHELTIDTYNRSAPKLAEYFQGIGPRVDDIELALELSGNPKLARTVEVGCGAGRDAVEIIKHVGWYEGFDPSAKMLELARKQVPGGNFVLAEALSYRYPDNLDVIFAFASLLHVDDADLSIVLQKFARVLRQGGIALISLKERSNYSAELKQDDYGDRMFYYYTAELVTELAEPLELVHEDHQQIGSSNWFTLALRKR